MLQALGLGRGWLETSWYSSNQRGGDDLYSKETVWDSLIPPLEGAGH